MFAVFVTVNVLPGQEEAFLTATAENHRQSLKEPGCRRFDVLRDAQSPQRFYLYEVYDDVEANAAHKASEHYSHWAALVESMMDGPRSSTRAIGLMPDPWR